MGAAKKKQPISRDQMKALWAAAKKGGLDEETLRDLVEAHTNSRSISGLSFDQARQILNELAPQTGSHHYRKNHGYGRQKYQDLPPRSNMATPKQLRCIEGMWAERSRATDKPSSLRQFLQNKFSVSDIRFLDRSRASQVITALEKMEVIDA